MKNPRSDGQATRENILEAAGKLFARRGYSETTSKEICEIANVNIAAINYYFGGKDGIYEAVLEEAHKNIVNFEISHEKNSEPEKKFRDVISSVLKNSDAPNWSIRVLLHEALTRATLEDEKIPPAFLEKINYLEEIISEILTLAKENEKVKRAASFVIMFCVGWIMLHDKSELQEINDAVNFLMGGIKNF